MHDIRAIRETPEPYVKGWDAKGLSGAALVAEITALDAKLRAAQTALAERPRPSATSLQADRRRQGRARTRPRPQRLMAEVEA